MFKAKSAIEKASKELNMFERLQNPVVLQCNLKEGNYISMSSGMLEINIIASSKGITSI